jgi:hypothetical protein
MQHLPEKVVETIIRLESKRKKQELSASTMAFINCRIELRLKLVGAAG